METPTTSAACYDRVIKRVINAGCFAVVRAVGAHGLSVSTTARFRVLKLVSWVIKMAVPKRKQSNARTGARRSHDFKKPVQTVACPDCNKMIQPHTVCPNCGKYMRRTVVNVGEE